MEYLEQIINTTLNSFDFAYCFIVNVFTYLVIKYTDELTPKPLSIWKKRLILLIIILSTGVVYSILGNDLTKVLNSAVLAPVFWSWIMKPLCKVFNIDYKDISNYIEN